MMELRSQIKCLSRLWGLRRLAEDQLVIVELGDPEFG
jgi:hypothetical protein